MLTVLGLSLAACDRGGGPQGAAPPGPHASSDAPALFEEVGSAMGLDAVNTAGIGGDYFMPEILGAGGALFDADGDGDLDVYVVRGGTGNGARNLLYLQGNDGTLEDVSGTCGADDPGFGMGVATGDCDNDGDVDLYVTNYGADALYLNDGQGTFTSATAASGLGNPGWACSAAFVDYDRDGWLDLFVVNYVHYPKLQVCRDQAGRPEYCGPQASPPTADILYRNLGDGRYEDVSAAAGIAAVKGRGLGVACDDFDGDGDTDVYVANDGEANFLWVNQGDGRFVESAARAGVALNMFANTEASMGVVAGDLDGDGDPDLFMTHLDRESNTFYRNDGAGRFVDDTAAANLGRTSYPLTGFGTALIDYDLDGDLDLAVVNGRVKRNVEHEGDDPSRLAGYAEPNLLFRNDGGGVFTDVSADAGDFAARREISRGLAVGDVDGDGRPDLLVTNGPGPALLYRNVAPDAGRWLTVRAVDPALRRDAVGARVSVTVAGRTLHRTVNPNLGYASSSDPRVTFGLGDADAVERLEVRWPDGSVEVFDAPGIDRIVILERGAGRAVELAASGGGA